MRLLPFLLLIGTALSGQQNLYDLENSKAFADYLLKSGQYESAVNEYERVLYMAPQDSASFLELMRAYRLSENNLGGLRRSISYFPTQESMPRNFAVEFSKLLLNLEYKEDAKAFWQSNTYLLPDDKILLNSTVDIFEGNFSKALDQLNGLQHPESPIAVGYKSLSTRGVRGPYKSPFLAGFLSTAIPGLGKVYTGDWKDAIVSVIFTGGMAFQAIRNFNRRGINDVRPWIYASVGMGFYLGNVVGSVKSAKDKNRKKINLLQHEASDYFNATF